MANAATISNTACYDSLSGCIKLPPASSEGGAVLEGSIIEMDKPPFQPGKLLLGEVVEIVIMDPEIMSPLAMYNRKTEKLRHASPPRVLSPSREELIGKQRVQQKLHFEQSHELMQKHHREKQHLDALQREGRLSNGGMAQLSLEMENIHQRELMELQDDHQREQSELMDLIFESASGASGGNAGKGHVDNNSGGKRAQEHWKKVFPATMAVGTIKRSRNATGGEEQPRTTRFGEKRSQSQERWNRAAAATMAAVTIIQSHDAIEDEEQHPVANDPAEKSGAAVATVAAGTINQINEIVINEVVNTPDSGPSTPLINKSPSKKNLESLKQEELKAVRRAHHIPRERNARRMVKVREKYPYLDSADLATSMQTPAAPQIESSKTIDELRREEVGSVMKDTSLNREEKQIQLAYIKAKYAALASSQAATSSIQGGVASAGLRNEAAVFTVESNTRAHTCTLDQLMQTTGNSSGSRWKQVIEGADKSNSDILQMKQAQGNSRANGLVIEQLQSNDSSLTTLILDGRKDVSDRQWTDLFHALEDNTNLTHLSVADCDLDDENMVPLVLALVENETLTSLDLSKNRDLTNDTGKSLAKVLKQSNPVLKRVSMDGTAISSEMCSSIRSTLDDRDDIKKLEKIQAAREKKIKELLALSALGDVSPSSRRLSQRLLEVEREGSSKSVNPRLSHTSGSTRGKKSKSRTLGRKKIMSSAELRGSNRSANSNSSDSRHSRGSKGLKAPPQTLLSSSSTHRSGGLKSSSNSANGEGGAGGGVNKGRRVARSTAAAHQMATLGGDVATGKSVEELRQGRRLRGECENCGQKLFQKTMFKTMPLTIPNKVHDGRCLHCAPQ